MKTARSKVTVIGPAHSVDGITVLDPTIYEGGIGYSSTSKRPYWSDGIKWNQFAATDDLLFNLTNPIEFTVGAGGDFATLGDALKEAARYSPGLASVVNPVSLITIRILAGTSLAEQIRLFFIDLSHVVIISDDPVVDVDISGFIWIRPSTSIGLPNNPTTSQTVTQFMLVEKAKGPLILTKFNAVGTNTLFVSALTAGIMSIAQVGVTIFEDEAVDSSGYDFRFGFVGNWTFGVSAFSSSYILIAQAEIQSTSNCCGVGDTSMLNLQRTKLRRFGTSNPLGIGLSGGLCVAQSCDLRVIDGTASIRDVQVFGVGGRFIYYNENIDIPGTTPTLGQIPTTFRFETDGFNTIYSDGPGAPAIITNPRIKGIPWLNAFTSATLPPAAAATGQMVYCSNGDGGNPCLAVSDGTNWRRISFGAAI